MANNGETLCLSCQRVMSEVSGHRVIPWEVEGKIMKLSLTQKEIVYGLILGDAYLQATGKHNARLRLEHSLKQKDYMEWLYENLKNIFANQPTVLRRKHPKSLKTYGYTRLQSHSSPWFGKLRNEFYAKGTKIVPAAIDDFLNSPRVLAVWYMDDGYYYERDKSAHIFVPRFSDDDLKRLIRALKKRFSIKAKIYCRPDRHACQLTFNGENLEKLCRIISPFIIPSLRYKLPFDPVTTASEKHAEN